jgi:peptidoglycan/xylan/chitin deacetylase (PgdA/CDA1 family)
MHRSEAVPAGFASWSAAAQADFLRYDVLPSALAADLDWLVANGYTTILPRDLAAHWDDGKPLPPRPVIISFDDGDATWTRTILPLLQARGMVAEFYLTLTTIHQGAITWDAVRELADAGMGIGAHDVDHFQLAALGAGHPPYPSSVMWYQVNEARIIIGDHVGTPPDSMAYVGGGFDATLVALVKRAGYTTARSIIRSVDQDVAHRYTLRVVRVGGTDDVVDPVTGTMVTSLPIFSAKVEGART